MKNQLTKTFLATSLLATSMVALAEGPGADWGNPYDLYMGSVDYMGTGVGHTGNHGSTVTGPDWTTCNNRLNTKKSMHTSAGDSQQLNEVPCYLKTTVLYQPMIFSPDFAGGNSGNSGNTTIHHELETLKEKYDIAGYTQQLANLRKEFNIDSFRAEYEKLHAKSLTTQKR